jgi:Polyketide cyclase / dehydrase and lipid transport
MLTLILIIVAVVIAIFLGIVALRPSEFHIERSIAISASSTDIFEQVNSLKKGLVWSPWVDLDHEAKYVFEGPDEGVGATNAWVGNKAAGEGRQTIIESRPGELVRIRLEFKKPFESTCMSAFVLKTQGNQTMVTWSIDGKNNFVARAFCLFMNMDKSIGGEFEKGLGRLKTLLESSVH